MMETLRCPSCGAPMDYDPRKEDETIRCPFCESTVVLPERQRPAPQTQTQTRIVVERTGDETAVTAGVIVAFVAVIVTGAVALFAFHQISKPKTNGVRGTTNTKNSLTTTKKNAGDGYAQPELSFGSEGIGPGNFTDARSIALDADGHIYVGEYSGGRIQVFDQGGKFLNQWTADRKMPLRGMAADRRGTVFVVQSDKITRYEGATGKTLGVLASGGYDDVATAANGGLVAFAWNSRDDIARLDSSGRVTRVIRAAISGQPHESELNARVARDGTGQIYAQIGRASCRERGEVHR